MATISYPRNLNASELAARIKGWLDARSFETKVNASGGSYSVKARKSSVWRAVAGADRALDVTVTNIGGSTDVAVSQGDWTTNIVSNAAWFFVTGGANVAISGWSVVIQKQLESFIRQTMEEMARKQLC